MLTKIIKHEFKLSLKEILIMSALCVILSAVSALLIKADIVVISGMFIMVFVVTIIATGLFTLLVLYRIFYKSMFDSEGYLTNIIPVKATTLVFGKFIAALILVSIVFIALLAGVFTFIFILVGFAFFEALVNFVGVLSSFLSIGTVLWIIYILASLLFSAAIFFACAAFLNTMQTKKYKFLILLLLYMVVSNVIGSLPSLPITVFAFQLSSGEPNITLMNIMLVVTIILHIGATGLMLLFTTHLVEKKVNID